MGMTRNATITPNVGGVPWHPHFVRLAACDTVPSPRMFSGVWYHATNTTRQFLIFQLLDFNISDDTLYRALHSSGGGVGACNMHA
jgi:hypothetical protein